MSLHPLDLVTQAQLAIGMELVENESMATRLRRTYMQELQARLAIGGLVEPGPLTFKSETMSVCHAIC